MVCAPWWSCRRDVRNVLLETKKSQASTSNTILLTYPFYSRACPVRCFLPVSLQQCDPGSISKFSKHWLNVITFIQTSLTNNFHFIFSIPHGFQIFQPLSFSISSFEPIFVRKYLIFHSILVLIFLRQYFILR